VSLHSGGERQQAPPVATSSAATTTGRSPCSTAWPPPWQLATTRLAPPPQLSLLPFCFPPTSGRACMQNSFCIQEGGTGGNN
jgi:hypothetical protein